MSPPPPPGPFVPGCRPLFPSARRSAAGKEGATPKWCSGPGGPQGAAFVRAGGGAGGPDWAAGPERPRPPRGDVGEVAGRGPERRRVRTRGPGSWPCRSPSPGPGDRCAQAGQGHLRYLRAARTGRGRGGDPASGASSACSARTDGRSTKERWGGGGAARARGRGAPPTGGASRSWGVMERCSLPHGNSPVTPVLRGSGGGRSAGDFRVRAAGLEMPRGPDCLPRGPSGDPGRKPSGAQAWREPPGRDEELSRSSEPLAPWPG